MTPIEGVPVSTIDGKNTNLGDFGGKVRLVVNVASKCGLTPQYTALEALYRKYKDRGFEILAFPANEFGGQEPGTEAEIQEFCSSNYDVSFPLFAKIVVKGEGQHPLYAKLTAERPEARNVPGSDFRAKLAGYGIVPASPSEVLWNFEKFLVDRSGNVIDRFAPDVTPDADLLVSAIERALGPN
jgi:glutathione peroxidase